MTNKDMTITTIEELKASAGAQLIELPPFVEGTRFVVKAIRPSILRLASEGKIPNELLETANNMFINGAGRSNTRDKKLMGKMFSTLETIAEQFFVEPTYQEIKDAGIDLTDDQYLFIFNYTQEGVRALSRFPTVESN